MLRIVVRGAYGVPLAVRKLPLNCVAVPALLVEDGAGHAAEAVAGHFVFAVAQAPERAVYGVLAHGPGHAA